MTTKFDPERAAEAQEWIETVTGERFSGSFHESLKDGVLLCKLLNKLEPGTVPKISTSKMPFNQMENIAAYISGSRKLGVPDEYNFMTVDLYEGKNLAQVVQNVISLKRSRGQGFQKQSKPIGQTTLLDIARDETTDKPVNLPREQTVLQTDQDVKRIGNAYVSGRNENTQAFTCPVCTKFVTTGVVNALGKTFHVACFTCKGCGIRLSSAKYYEYNNNAYCERCILIAKPQESVKANTKDMGFKWNEKK